MSDDWNEIIGAGFPGPGFKRAVGRGRGRGRGLLNVEKENSVGGQFKFNSVQGNEQNGFESMGSISEDWGDCKPMESTFGKKPFSISNNTQIDLADNKLNQRTFGQKAFSISNEGAENWDGDMPDKGGFGQKSFTQSENNTEDWGGTNTKNATFRNTGFRSSANGSSENKTGFRCPGGSTEFSNTSDVHFGGGFNKRRNDNREDVSASGRSGKGSCYKCGEEGHIARDCPQGGSRGGGSGACYKCGEEGHIARDCPQGGGQGRGSCYNCGKGGHMSRDCQSNRSGKFGGSRTDDSGRPGTEKPPENYIPPPPSENEQEIFKTLEQGINFDKYDEIKVFVTGRDAPQRGISSFTEADLHEIVQQNVLRAKYSKPTPVQKHAVPVIMQNRDLMACAQTGSGKTAAFLLPVLTKMLRDGLDGSSFSEIQEPQAIIIGPTRELVVQIYNEARKFAYNTMLRPVVVYGGTSVSYQLQQVSRGAHMVVGTPGRLKDFIQRGKISLAKVKYLILDEADRMLDMGFEPIVRQIVEQMGMTGKDSRQTLMFSATFPEEIQKLASDFLMDHIFITVGRVGGANLDIKQAVYQVEKNEKREKLVSILNEMGTSRTLVFVEQKRSTDFLAAFLCQFDFPATSIHGDRYQSQREEALADFKSGRKPILVATSVASRGLDIPGVEHVVNFDLPKSIDEYVHRIGRTGRCGNLGKATSFFDPQVDAEIAQPLVNILTDAQQEVPEWLADTAERSYCTATNYSGKYGGRDIRKKQNKTAYSDDFNAGAFNDGFPSSLEDPAVEEEIWDI